MLEVHPLGGRTLDPDNLGGKFVRPLQDPKESQSGPRYVRQTDESLASEGLGGAYQYPGVYPLSGEPENSNQYDEDDSQWREGQELGQSEDQEEEEMITPSPVDLALRKRMEKWETKRKLKRSEFALLKK